MQSKILRPAIAMIELIFAIVIMGVTLLSAPLILNMSVQSYNIAIQQESIAAASSQLSLILTYPWDQGDSNSTTGYGILQTTHQDTKLRPANRLHATNATSTYMRRTYNTGTQEINASLPATFGNTYDAVSDNDIDDFHDVSTTVRLYHSTSETSDLDNNEGEYLKSTNFTIVSSVKYGLDTASYLSDGFEFNDPFSIAASNQSTNIKLISVTLSNSGALANSEEHNQSITLRAFACNIGSAYSMGTDIVEMP